MGSNSEKKKIIRILNILVNEKKIRENVAFSIGMKSPGQLMISVLHRKSFREGKGIDNVLDFL